MTVAEREAMTADRLASLRALASPTPNQAAMVRRMAIEELCAEIDRLQAVILQRAKEERDRRYREEGYGGHL